MFRFSPLVRSGGFAELSSGLRLHYASSGDPTAPLLLFLHGFPEFWFAWHDFMPQFADDFHVVAPDLRGYNLSDKPAGTDQYQMRLLVADVLDLIASLGHEQARVVAHDWGGMLAWSAIIAQPEKFRAAMIMNAPHPIPFARDLARDPAQQTASRYMNKLRQAHVEQELLANYCEGFERFFQSPGYERWYTQAVATQYRTAWQQPGAASSMVNYYRASPIFPPQGRDAGAAALALDPDQYRVNVPVRILWGMRDPALLSPLLNGLDELVSDLAIERVEQATHWLHHEHPELVAARINDFIEEFTDDGQ